MPPGDYQIYISALDDAYVKSIRLGEEDLLTRDLHLESSLPDRLEITIARTGGAVAGRVFNESRQAIANSTVVLIPDVVAPLRLDRFETATTDASGNFQLRGIAPGAYNLFAWEDVDKDAWFDPNFIRLYQNLARPIRIAENANETVELSVIR